MNEDSGCSDATYALLNAFRARWPHAEYGPAHIVISDDNVSDSSLALCRAEVGRALAGAPEYAQHSHDELIATLACLVQLAAIPEEDR